VEWVVNYIPLLPYPQKYVPQYPQTGRLNGIQSQSGWFGEEENLLFMLGIELWITQAVPLSLYWVHYPSMMYSVSTVIPTVHPTALFYLVYFVCYIGHDQFIVLSYVLEQHMLVYSALYRESTSILCICHSFLRVIIGISFYHWITCFT